MERCVANIVLNIRIGTMLQQKLHDRELTVFDSEMQRTPAVFRRSGVDCGSGSEKRLDVGHVALETGSMQWTDVICFSSQRPHPFRKRAGSQYHGRKFPPFCRV